jgi:hypothetical protein
MRTALKKSKVTIEGKELDTLRYSLSSVFKGDPDGDDVTSELPWEKLTNRTHRGSGSGHK